MDDVSAIFFLSVNLNPTQSHGIGFTSFCFPNHDGEIEHYTQTIYIIRASMGGNEMDSYYKHGHTGRGLERDTRIFYFCLTKFEKFLQ